MVSANLHELELHTGTVDGDPDIEAHFAFPMFWATGNVSTAVLCVELDPGKSGPRHIDMPEEILLVEQGEVAIEVGDDSEVFGSGCIVLVPAMEPHAFRNVGKTRARVVGFFPSNTVVAIADEVVQPIGSRVIGSPPPELAGAV
jgi:mannose-6-phosphate isomerase-like protein (cupin superfamily)